MGLTISVTLDRSTFTYDGDIRFSSTRVVAAQQVSVASGIDKTVLYEEFSSADNGQLYQVNSFQQSNLPTALRPNFIGSVSGITFDRCDRRFGNPIRTAFSPLCNDIFPLLENSCGDYTIGMSVLLADPSSVGEVTLDSLGNPRVNVNYMDTPDDIEALGKAARVGYEILTNFPAPIGPPVVPCEDPTDEACTSTNCPELTHS